MRLGLVSDIHGQTEALRQALQAMGPIDRLLCLGDSIQQARFCNETVRMLRDRDVLAIRGNHEEAFFAGTGRTAPHVDPTLADWLAALPASIGLEADGRRILLVHSTPWPSGHAYVPPSHRDFHRFAEVKADILIYGHTHLPVNQRVGGVLVVNPGSVGEGRPTGQGFVRSCAVLDVAAMTAEIIDLD
jgi:putative phosphoesterase